MGEQKQWLVVKVLHGKNDSSIPGTRYSFIEKSHVQSSFSIYKHVLTVVIAYSIRRFKLYTRASHNSSHRSVQG